MDRNLLLPVAGTLIVVLLVYLAASSSMSIDPTPAEGEATSNAVRSPAPTHLEQHAGQPAEVQALAALADAGLGRLVVCSLSEPLAGTLSTGPWPTHLTATQAAFLVPEHEQQVRVVASDGAGVADLEWIDGTPARCTSVDRWIYTVEVLVLGENEEPVTNASVLVSGRMVGAPEDGVYVQRRSARERPDPNGAATVLTAEATQGTLRGSASANVVDDRVQITVKLGTDGSPTARLTAMSMQGQAMRAMESRRALSSSLDKALGRESLSEEARAVLAGWRGRRAELPEPARLMAPPSRMSAPTRVPVAPKDRETQKRVAPVP